MTLRSLRLRILFLLSLIGAPSALAKDVRISIPKRTPEAPVQRLNREGVEAVKKHDMAKAEKLFYKSYLIDPNDPFTLNNLGYISEVKGNIQRAQQFYELAAKTGSDSNIDVTSDPALKGHSLTEVTETFASREMRINRGNVQAMRLLQDGRTQEAEDLLKATLAIDPKSAFTLNNLGYTMEGEGELDAAQRYYTEAANLHSTEPVVVSPDRRWLGKPISEVANKNAWAVHDRRNAATSIDAQVARLNVRGVYALNHNEPDRARSFFEAAYQLKPSNAFSLNNMGYVSELNGDQETAQEYYQSAQAAGDARTRINLANHREAVGERLTQVAGSNDTSSQNTLDAQREARRREAGPIELKRRDNSLVQDPEPAPPAPANPQPNQ